MNHPGPGRHVTYAIGVLTAISAGVVAFHIKPIPLAAEVKVTVEPAGAEVLVDGKLEGRAPLQAYVNPGQHAFEARAAGYEFSGKVLQTFEDGGSGFVNMKLTPIPASLQIVTDLTTGSLTVGGRTELIPREGNLALRMPLTTKSVELAAGNVRVVAPIELKPGAMPDFNGSVLTANARVVSIAWGGGKAYAEASYSPVEFYVDGVLTATLVTDGVALPPLGPGLHRIKLVDNGRVFERPVTVTEVPGMALLVSGAEQNLGNLMVKVNVEGARILVDGAEFRSASVVGENFIANLRVRVAMVQVKKDGYEAVEARPVQLRRGETVTVEFEMKPEGQ